MQKCIQKIILNDVLIRITEYPLMAGLFILLGHGQDSKQSGLDRSSSLNTYKMYSDSLKQFMSNVSIHICEWRSNVQKFHIVNTMCIITVHHLRYNVFGSYTHNILNAFSLNIISCHLTAGVSM